MIEFKPARRENVSLLIALAGASGSGKTMSALRLAQGIAAGGKIAMIDTEARRGLHYADRFDFLHCDMRAPFTTLAFNDVLARSERDANAAVVIIDSFSHEYDGEGGLIDHADRLLADGVKSPGNWKEPKMAHRRLMRDILQCRATLIFCLRADEKIAIERKEIEERGQLKMKFVVTPLGWTPICEKRFMYEMTASFTLDPSDPGKPKFHLPHKLQEQHRPFFPEGQFIDQRAGEQLAAWAKGSEPPPDDLFKVLEEGNIEARAGTVAFGLFWRKLPMTARNNIGASQFESWKQTAKDADKVKEAVE
jgi:hypothetical protein